MQQLRPAGDDDLFRHGADTELQVHLRPRLHADSDLATDRATKALKFGRHHVDTDAQAGKDELPAIVGGRGGRHTRAILRRHHGNAGQDCPAVVDDPPDDYAGIDLCEGIGGKDEQNEQGRRTGPHTA